jgi:hypothetical protein
MPKGTRSGSAVGKMNSAYTARNSSGSYKDIKKESVRNFVGDRGAAAIKSGAGAASNYKSLDTPREKAAKAAKAKSTVKKAVSKVIKKVKGK